MVIMNIQDLFSSFAHDVALRIATNTATEGITNAYQFFKDKLKSRYSGVDIEEIENNINLKNADNLILDPSDLSNLIQDRELLGLAQNLLQQLNEPFGLHERRLKQFLKTEECEILLQNPERLGYISPIRQIIACSIALILLCTILFLFGYGNQFSDPISSFLRLVICIFYTFAIGYTLLQIYPALKSYIKNETLIKKFDVKCFPVWVLSVYPTVLKQKNSEERANIITVETPNRERFEFIQRLSIVKKIIRENDIGVIYLSQRNNLIDFARSKNL
jgi:hypothetical protein